MASSHPKTLWCQIYDLMTKHYWHSLLLKSITFVSLKQAQLRYVSILSILVKSYHLQACNESIVLKLYFAERASVAKA